MFFEVALFRTMFPSNALTHNRPWGSLDCWEMCVHTSKYCLWTKLKFVGKNAFMNHFICNLGLLWTKVEFICKTQPWTNLFMIYGVHKPSQDLFIKLNPKPIRLQFEAFVNQVNICLHSFMNQSANLSCGAFVDQAKIRSQNSFTNQFDHTSGCSWIKVKIWTFAKLIHELILHNVGRSWTKLRFVLNAHSWTNFRDWGICEPRFHCIQLLYIVSTFPPSTSLVSSGIIYCQGMPPPPPHMSLFHILYSASTLNLFNTRT